MSTKPVVIITGAAGGIGSATASRFAEDGFLPVLTDIDNEGLMKTGEFLSRRKFEHSLIAGNLEDISFLEHITANTLKKYDRIDVLVNNAAWRTRETLRTVSIEDWERTIRVCLTAPAFLTKQVANVMEEKNIQGAIVNVSSIQSFFAGGTSPAYTVCKAGLESLTYEAAVLYGPSGIRVNVVLPGAVNTALSNDITNEENENVSSVFTDAMIDQTPLKRFADREEIANVICWLASKKSSFVTGTSVVADGGFTHNFNAYSLKKLQFPKQF
ncbi:MAG: SDR family oxidoreductase [Sphingobacteriales bacterium]|nr:SDR family oxidoreductase [Sphingobacteriales bacterium]OJY91341.1 MAG: hypothetical protein BGP14_16085 [Sphingobacteriales bacterium 44-15]